MKFTELPRIDSTLCSQEDFEDAVRVLEECYSPAVNGLIHPYFAPGGDYGRQWWSLDYALALEGAKWLDFSLGKAMIENFSQIQGADGWVPLWGAGEVANFPNTRREPVASLPKYFESAFKIALMSGDADVRRQTLELFEKSIEWWMKNRQDPQTDLITAVFEETFIPNAVSGSFVYAPPDTNIEVAIGCRNAARLAELDNQAEKALHYRKKEQEILKAVDEFLWNDEKGAYLPFILPERRHEPCLMASAFLGFHLQNTARGERLGELLHDSRRFNWNTHPLTTVAIDDERFAICRGKYTGNPCWSGSIWALTNVSVIDALTAGGKMEDAAELAAKTVQSFRGNYAEFLTPDTGSGEGVIRYAWTASLFIRIIIENLFGISYTWESGVTANPNFPERYAAQPASLDGLTLPDGKRIRIDCLNNHAEIRCL